jgi:hypothetical protein
VRRKYRFAVDSIESTNLWLDGLLMCVEDTLCAAHPLVVERWLRKEFNRMVLGGDGVASAKEPSYSRYSWCADGCCLKVGPHRLNERIPTKLLKPFIQSRLQKKISLQELHRQQLNVDEDDMNYQQLSDTYRKLVHQPQVRHIMHNLTLKCFCQMFFLQIFEKILSRNGELNSDAEVVSFDMFFQFLQNDQQVGERWRPDTSIAHFRKLV